MDGSVALARYVVDAVVLEGRGVREVARAHGVSKSWVSVLVARYRSGGYEALEPRSRRANTRANRTPDEVEDAIVRIRKDLSEDGFDAGARTIHWHLSRERDDVPSISTIWRVLARRGFIDARAEEASAHLVHPLRGRPAERMLAVRRDPLAAPTREGRRDPRLHRRPFACDRRRRVTGITKVHDVVATFHEAGARWGYPASVLTDNAAVFNAAARKGTNAFETELEEMGIVYKHSRPYHPQTCGKIERWHQTLKRFLIKQRRARSLVELQAQLDRFVTSYNEERPHRARGSLTPKAAFDALAKARPGSPVAETHFRVRTDKVDSCGKVTLRHGSRLFHIGIGRRHKGTRIRLYVAGLDVRVVTWNGELLRHLTLDTSRAYQPSGSPRSYPRGGSRVPR